MKFKTVTLRMIHILSNTQNILSNTQNDPHPQHDPLRFESGDAYIFGRKNPSKPASIQIQNFTLVELRMVSTSYLKPN